MLLKEHSKYSTAFSLPELLCTDTTLYMIQCNSGRSFDQIAADDEKEVMQCTQSDHGKNNHKAHRAFVSIKSPSQMNTPIIVNGSSFKNQNHISDKKHLHLQSLLISVSVDEYTIKYFHCTSEMVKHIAAGCNMQAWTVCTDTSGWDSVQKHLCRLRITKLWVPMEHMPKGSHEWQGWDPLGLSVPADNFQTD